MDVQRYVRKIGAASLLILCCLFPGRNTHAVEPAREPTPLTWNGAVELGYRFTDIDGTERYREVVNLSEGLRVFNADLHVKDGEEKAFVDDVRIQVRDLGDPYPTGRLDIRKHKAYHLAATYRESNFLFDREDAGVLLTDNHDFNQLRKNGALTLSAFPTGDLSVNLGYSFARREGEAGVPRIFTFVPNLTQDLDEGSDEFFVSASFPVAAWDLDVKQSYSTYFNKDRIDQPPTLIEERDEEVITHVSTIKAHRLLSDRLDFDGGYIYARSDGDAQLNIRPALLVGPGGSSFVFDTHVLESGMSLGLRENLIAHLDYRFHTFEQDGRAGTDFFFLPLTEVRTDYHLLAHTGTLQLEHLPAKNLTLKGGYRLQYSDIEAENFNLNQFDGGASSENAQILSHGWLAEFNWKPLKSLSLDADYEGAVFDDPYTRISPENQHTGKVKIRYETPLPDLDLTGTALWKRKTNPGQEFLLNIQDYTMAAFYQPARVPGLTLDASFTYERIEDEKLITTLVPPPQLFPTFVFDSDALIYSGEIRFEEISQGLGARLGGSLARTREENDQEYARGILSLWHRTKWVTTILSFERSYLTDYQNRADDFTANWITLSFRKEF